MRERTILCYGDSNTWGANPLDISRFDRFVRWPGKLESMLGPDWHVAEAGAPNRTTAFEDPLIPFRNGCETFSVFLETHSPIDGVVVMLGTNDPKTRVGGQVEDAVLGLAKIGNQAKVVGAKVLLVAPPLMVAPIKFEEFDAVISVRYLEQLAIKLEEMCLRQEFHFLNAGDYVSVSPLDGVHLDEIGHANLATAVVGRIREIFS